MIVYPIPEGWEIIYQQAHGVLAAQIAYCLKPALRCSHWLETLVAIANHDNRQKTWRGKDGLTEAGAPADFTLLPPTLEQAKALMHEVRFQSRWVTLLTSMHMCFIYAVKRGEGKDFAAFLDEQQEVQKSCCKSLSIQRGEAANAYAILQWCDSLSLILCRNELPKAERSLEIAALPDGKTYMVKQLKDETLQITPWPFEKEELEVQVEYRKLKQLHFKNDEELAKGLHQADVKLKTWLFKK